jgi:glutamyl/glutaminyl-tRNA synthetase
MQMSKQRYTLSRCARREYGEVIGQLIDTGRVFACRCSRRDMMAHDNICVCKSDMLPLDTPDTALRIETRDEPIIIHDAEMGQQSVFLDSGV